MTWRDELNWAGRLTDYLAEQRAEHERRDFEWGELDCATFACDWVKHITGRDPMEEFRGKYSGDNRSAALALRESGDGTFFKACVRCLGEPLEKPFRAAEPGDIAFLDKCLGIVSFCGGRKRAYFVTHRGIGIVQDWHWQAAFKVQ